MFTRPFLRSVSCIVLVTFTSLTLQPLQAAVMVEQKTKPTVAASQVQAVPPSRDERYSKGLAGMRELLERAETKQKRAEGGRFFIIA
ncbi:MAG: hypothetical protein WAO71_00020 [Gallionella sp.]